MAYSAQVEQWRPLVEQYFPPHLVDKALWVIQYESGGNPSARGDGGIAIGLFQIQARPEWGRPPADVLLNPEENIRYAAQNLGAANGNWGAWGEGQTYNGQPFGALGNHPYPGSGGTNVTQPSGPTGVGDPAGPQQQTNGGTPNPYAAPPGYSVRVVAGYIVWEKVDELGRVTDTIPVGPVPTDTSGAPTVRNDANGNLIQWNPTAGRWDIIQYKDQTSSQQPPTTRDFPDGTLRQYDYTSGQWVVIGQPPPSQQQGTLRELPNGDLAIIHGDGSFTVVANADKTETPGTLTRAPDGSLISVHPDGSFTVVMNAPPPEPKEPSIVQSGGKLFSWDGSKLTLLADTSQADTAYRNAQLALQRESLANTRSYQQGQLEISRGQLALSREQLEAQKAAQRQEAIQRFTDQFAKYASMTDPAAFAAFLATGGGNVGNAIATGGNAISRAAVTPAATALGELRKLGINPAGDPNLIAQGFNQIPQMAAGGYTTAPVFISGDTPSGAGGNPELMVNPTRAPIAITPIRQLMYGRR